MLPSVLLYVAHPSVEIDVLRDGCVLEGQERNAQRLAMPIYTRDWDLQCRVYSRRRDHTAISRLVTPHS
jgi:hypothetical protein